MKKLFIGTILIYSIVILSCDRTDSINKDVSKADNGDLLMKKAKLGDDEMVRVPAGEFQMGCSHSNDPLCKYTKDEFLHAVFLDEFLIDKYEVTFEKYERAFKAGLVTEPANGGALNYGWPGVAKFPINGVTWKQAKKYCESIGKRLPTEAEWEKAARGTDLRMYPWGNEKPTPELAVMDKPNAGYLGCGTGNTLDVGSKPKGVSPYGAMDMAGNLWEWTADWYNKDYYKNSPKNNPKGPAKGTHKTCRGGDFFSRDGYELKTTGRFPYEPSDYSIAIGFRCAKSIK
jgi:formylglycine-generating enzyme required for sulfatase activity